MAVRFKSRAEPVPDDVPVQSLALADMSREQLIDAMLEDTLDPACSIRPVMKNLLLKGHKGYENMTNDELRHLVRNRSTLPGEPEVQDTLLPIENKE